MTDSIPPHHRVILCCGMSRSGSTWAYNTVRHLLAPSRGVYAETLSALAMDLATPGDPLAIKCHGPDAGVRWMARAFDVPTIISVRDPRDSVVSFMQCFSRTFEAARKAIDNCGRQLLALERAQCSLVLRYEDGLGLAATSQIAAVLGVSSPALISATQASLSRDAVRQSIAHLEANYFDADKGPTQFEPETHWHPGHVGDGAVGKFETYLSPEQQSEVMSVSEEYARRFGYI